MAEEKDPLLELYIYDRFKVRRVFYFSDFTVNLDYLALGSTFSVSFYFNPNDPEHKELACVTHYHTVTGKYNGEFVVKGFILSQGFKLDPVKQLATLSGYSMPGVFEDSSIPPTLYPLQSDGLSLLSITRKLISPWSEKYGIEIIVDPEVSADVNGSFKKSTAGEGSTIGEYLRELARQKDIITTHDEKGNLVYTRAKTKGKPLIEFDFSNGVMPATSISMDYDGQGMHSDLYMQRQASTKSGNAGYFHLKNPYCPILYRPKTFTQSSGEDNDTEKACRRELAKELESLKFTIETDRWKINDKIVRPNNTLTVIAPEIYVYTKALLFISAVTLVGDAGKTTATWTCMIPETVNGEYPTSIFQGINLHA